MNRRQGSVQVKYRGTVRLAQKDEIKTLSAISSVSGECESVDG